MPNESHFFTVQIGVGIFGDEPLAPYFPELSSQESHQIKAKGMVELRKHFLVPKNLLPRLYKLIPAYVRSHKPLEKLTPYAIFSLYLEYAGLPVGYHLISVHERPADQWNGPSGRELEEGMVIRSA